MQYQVNGKTISLTKQDFLAQGGEGAVYVKGSTAFKIALDPSRMIPVGKIRELSGISNPNIIKPENVIYKNNQEVGYTMRYVDHTYPLCQTFTQAFRKRHQVSNDQMVHLIQRLQQAVHDVHNAGVLIVDLNEMNWLVSDDFKQIYGIDVDSYQTEHFPATALMDSVRDRHSPNVFNHGTDWFSFAIVSFQMFVGIHPYKGKHPTIKSLDQRMQKNISVFNSDVRIPKAALPLKLIPQEYANWYQAVLDRGQRVAPPSLHGVTIIQPVSVQQVVSTGSFTVTCLREYDKAILFFMTHNGTDLAIGDDNIFMTYNNSVSELQHDNNDLVSFCFYNGVPYKYSQQHGQPGIVTNLVLQKNFTTQFQADSIMAYKGRLYLRTEDLIYEVLFHGGMHNPVISQQVVCHVLPHATKLFPGVVIQNLLGECFVSIFPESRQCYQFKIEQIKNHKLIDAKYDNGVLMIVGFNDQQYVRYIFSIVKGRVADMRIVKDVDYCGLNFVTLSSGICVSVTEEDKIEIFHRERLQKVKIIDDDSITNANQLFSDGNRVLTIDGNRLLQLRSK